MYLPREWTDDAARCRQAGVPSEVGFATKPQLAWQQIEAALQAGYPRGTVLAVAGASYWAAVINTVILSVGANASDHEGTWVVERAVMSRSARRLMDGQAFVPAYWSCPRPSTG